MGQQSENEWIEWAGGECPVPVGSTVQYRTRAGFESGVVVVPEWYARSSVWAHDPPHYDPDTDIIAYRVVSAS
jgi:hypothetical protein